MDKRTFLKLSSALTVAPLVTSIESFGQQERLRNWAGNLEYSTNDVHYPKSVAEVREIIKKFDKIKVLGTRHCFNDIANSKYHLLSTKELNKLISIDRAGCTVTIEGGMNYGQLCPQLDQQGFALHNLASLPHISVAGACTTATHGSGVNNGNLATAVTAIELLLADGSIVNLSKERDGERFNAAVVGLGALGVVTKITLSLKPTFKAHQFVYLKLPLAQLKENFDKIMSGGYSVSLFTDWSSESVNEVWVKDISSGKQKTQVDYFGAKPAPKNMHPIADFSSENCTEQMGEAGTWYERLPHFKMGFTPSSGKELQAEYFVPRKNGLEAFLAIQKMGKEIMPHLFISEIRSVAADELWMSPCYQQDCIAIHFTWKQDWPAVSKLLPKIEKELSIYDVKPHWGKLFTLSPSMLAGRYGKMQEFRKLATEFDPKGKFRNDFLNKYLFI